ncbi:MAG: TldD/PmbA family protein [Parabacteroides sp.]|jgi:TldD protein|nr:TldD/PmbA family protein [Parabacteroides sp.]MBP8758780.1 TldD/PmbA family protein [Parabacteroides sp.]MBP9481449.1 TldD/PmbA family protein [Parabacteroides sp.]MBP9579384.1 TldD/PmbA family protein [Parabacteroides sp.]MDD4403402.1 TldD/PmbA family protein [Parabacteroides sp.]
MSFNRREFIKTGGIVMLGSLAAPSLLGEVTGQVADKATGVLFALNHFGVSESDLKKVLTAALEKGGDYADLFFEHTYNNYIGLQDGAVNRASSNIDFGVGVRVLSGDQSGYAYVENVTLEEMLTAARTAARIANGSAGKAMVNLTEMPIVQNYYAIKSPWDEVAVNTKMPYLQKLNDLVFSLDKRVHKVSASLSDSTSHIFFCNSEGVMYYDYRPMVTLGAQCIMEENGKIENSYASRAFRMGTEFLTDELISEVANEAVSKTAILFQAVKPKGGEMPVVMGAGGSGILLHEAIGHAFEADFNRKNTSIFSDQLNKKICNEHINVVDDGTIPFNRGSVNIDDEGVEGQKTYIVKEGILTSYLHDRISAKHYGIASTGNGRRESFRQMPIPRMRATYMESGNVSEEDMISTVKKGIFADVFTNGQVQIGAGDFTFFVKSGYLIENGKLTQPIKDINIIGNGPKALADITMVGNNYKMDNGTWTCGKDGQSCPVTCGMPSALVSKLTVGGEN